MHKFKIGDRVVLLCTNKDMYRRNSYMGELKKGHVGTVVDTESASVKVDNEGLGCWIDVNQIDLAPECPNQPHKHKDLIIAWANGDDIQSRADDGTWWSTRTPMWSKYREYRVTPAKTEREIKLEKLKEQARKLADEIEGLEC